MWPALLVGTIPLWTGTVLLARAEDWPWVLLCGTSTLLSWLIAAAYALLRSRVVIVTVHGRSMEPTYHDGDKVLVRRNSTLRPGAVVVVERPDDGDPLDTPPRSKAKNSPMSSRMWIIKRVAAVPGDPLPPGLAPALGGSEEDHVPTGKLILLGDNPGASLDSRHHGYFPAERVLGTVQRILSHPGHGRFKIE